MPFGGQVNEAASLVSQFTGMIERSTGVIDFIADLPDKLGSVDGVMDLIFRCATIHYVDNRS